MEWISFIVGMVAGAFLLAVLATVFGGHHSDDFDDYPN